MLLQAWRPNEKNEFETEIVLKVKIPKNAIKNNNSNEMNEDCKHCSYRDYFDKEYYCCKWLSYTPKILLTSKKKYCCLPKGTHYIGNPTKSDNK